MLRVFYRGRRYAHGQGHTSAEGRSKTGDQAVRLALSHVADSAGAVQHVYIGQQHPEELLLQVRNDEGAFACATRITHCTLLAHARSFATTKVLVWSSMEKPEHCWHDHVAFALPGQLQEADKAPNLISCDPSHM